MGLSIVGATAIIGVSLVIALELLMGSVFPAITDSNISFKDLKNRSIEQAQTSINVTSISTSANGSNYDLNITLENSGNMPLETNDFNILINGTNHVFTCGKKYLYPESQAFFNVYYQPGEGNRRLKIVTNNGISEYHEYTIS